MGFWNILGVDVQVWERRRAVESLDARLGANRPTCVAFANANLLNLAATNPGLRSILKTRNVAQACTGGLTSPKFHS